MKSPLYQKFWIWVKRRSIRVGFERIKGMISKQFRFWKKQDWSKELHGSQGNLGSSIIILKVLPVECIYKLKQQDGFSKYALDIWTRTLSLVSIPDTWLSMPLPETVSNRPSASSDHVSLHCGDKTDMVKFLALSSEIFFRDSLGKAIFMSAPLSSRPHQILFWSTWKPCMPPSRK